MAWSPGLASFLRAYRQLRPAPRGSRPTPKVLDPERLHEVLTTLRSPLADARESGVMLNPWIMAGLGRNEIRNASVLASFISPRICGRFAVDLLNAFLEPLRSDAQPLPTRTDLESGYHVRTEHYVTGNERDRVDLTIEGSEFVLGIEVKIDAPEGPLQLERYVETIRRWGQRRSKRAAVIFLAPYSADRPDVISADWHLFVAASRKVVARTKTDRTETQKLLQLFARHVADF